MEPYRSWQSVCRFSLPFLLPLLVAASRCRLAKQNHCAVQYCRRRDCRCRAEFGKFGFFCSLFTIHYSLRSRCRLAKQNNCELQYRRPIADLERSLENLAFSVHCSLFTIHCEAVAVWQNKITARYNIVEEGTADVEGIGELKLVSSLITHHSSFFLPAPRFTAFLFLSFRSIAFLCALCASAVKFGFPASCFTLLLSPVIAENLIQNCLLNQFVVRSAPAFALYLQELQ